MCCRLRLIFLEKGEVNLLASPPLEEAAQLLSGTGADATGAKSLAMGAAIEVPWAGRISGVAYAGWGEPEHDVAWDAHGSAGGREGQLRSRRGGGCRRPAAEAGRRVRCNTNVMPDGGEAQATFRAGNFNGHWPSQTEITTTVRVERQGDRTQGGGTQYRQPRRNRSGSAGIRDLRF